MLLDGIKFLGINLFFDILSTTNHKNVQFFYNKKISKNLRAKMFLTFLLGHFIL